jgi:hypothetical protein
MSNGTRLRNLGPAALLVAFLATTVFTFQGFVTEQGTFFNEGGRNWFIALSQAMVGTGSIPFILATLLLVRRNDLPRITKLLFRIAALVSVGQVVLALTWIAYEWNTIYRSSQAWTRITTGLAAAIVALVALQPPYTESADREQGVAVEGPAGELGGATDAAHQ